MIDAPYSEAWRYVPLKRSIVTLVLICASGSLALYACTTADDSPSSAAHGAPPDASVAADPPDASARPDSATDADAAIATATLASFDPTKGELPEAISFRDGSAYVSLVATGQI